MARVDGDRERRGRRARRVTKSASTGDGLRRVGIRTWSVGVFFFGGAFAGYPQGADVAPCRGAGKFRSYSVVLNSLWMAKNERVKLYLVSGPGSRIIHLNCKRVHQATQAAW